MAIMISNLLALCLGQDHPPLDQPTMQILYSVQALYA